MKIAVGSTNPAKVEAVMETLQHYPILLVGELEIIPRDVPSGVSDQPIGLEEIIKGAKNRASLASKDVDFSFGIESGLIRMPPNFNEAYFDITICAIYDPRTQLYTLGQSCGFMIPPKVMDLIKTKNLNLSDAFFEAKISKDRNIGKSEGAIGLLTRGRLTRDQYTQQAIMMALIPLEQDLFYKP